MGSRFDAWLKEQLTSGKKRFSVFHEKMLKVAKEEDFRVSLSY